MSKPKNKEEYRKEMAEAFAHILEEKGLQWKKEWFGFASAPQNGVTKANYRGCNAFWLSIVAMSKGYTDPRWVTMRQIQDFDGRYHVSPLKFASTSYFPTSRPNNKSARPNSFVTASTVLISPFELTILK